MAANETTNDKRSEVLQTDRRDNVALIIGIITVGIAISGLLDDTGILKHSLWIPAGAAACFVGLWAISSTLRSLINPGAANDLSEPVVDH